MQVSNKKSKDLKTESLKIKVNSIDHPYPLSEIPQKLLQPRRLSSYFIILIDSGSVNYQLDLQDISIADGDVLFAMPNQFFVPPAKTDDLKYFKIIFDENTVALLPQRFSFLVNPLNAQTISVDQATRERLRTVFVILNQLLNVDKQSTDTEIILAYLNLLLSELNNAYFKNESVSGLNANLSKFVEFKIMVDTHLTEQPSINAIAEKLSLTTNSLYRIVKDYSGSSPKDFLTNQLMIEAQRKLRYSNLSVKELAYELGFNDPDYFSRLFKKSTGKSVSDFLLSQDL